MDDSSIEQPLDLRKYVAVIRTRKWTILIVAALVLASALFISFRRTPIYAAQARLLVKPNPSVGYYPVVTTEAQVVSSTAVATLVMEELELQFSPQELLGGLEATPLSDNSSVILVRYTSPDPVFAKLAADAFAESYIIYQRNQQDATLETQRQSIRQRIAALQNDIRELITDIETARDNNNESRVATLETQRSAYSTRLGLLQQQLDDLQPTVSATTGVGDVLERASEPTTPVSPDHVSDGLLGMFAGLSLGLALAFLRERLDDRFKGRPDVEVALQAPVLATVPRFPRGQDKRDLITLSDPKGPASEAYRNLRTTLQFICMQRDAKTILVTSPSEHEGKTATTANLGIALSQTGKRVILVSADLRRPQLERYFGATSEVGLSSWLLGDVDDIAEILLEDPSGPNIRLIPSGPIPSNPAELLTSPRLTQLITELEPHCDFLLFDSPPTLPVADSVIIASHIKMVLLILNAANTARSAAVHAKEQLERVGGEVVGVVLNAFDPTSSPYYYEPYYYSPYYNAVAESDESRHPSSASNGGLEQARKYPEEEMIESRESAGRSRSGE